MPIANQPIENEDEILIELFHPGNKAGHFIPGHGYFYPAHIIHISEIKVFEINQAPPQFYFIVTTVINEKYEIKFNEISELNLHYSELLRKIDIFYCGDIITE